MNEEPQYFAEFYCTPVPTPLSEADAEQLMRAHMNKQFPEEIDHVQSLRLFPLENGCTKVQGSTYSRKLCDESQGYGGAIISITVCEGAITKSSFYCDDY